MPHHRTLTPWCYSIGVLYQNSPSFHLFSLHELPKLTNGVTPRRIIFCAVEPFI